MRAGLSSHEHRHVSRGNQDKGSAGQRCGVEWLLAQGGCSLVSGALLEGMGHRMCL